MTEDPRRDAESRRILDRVSKETSGDQSIVARAARRSRDHIAAGDADQDDWIELWGTRIGRIAGLAFIAGLLLWLVLHLLNG